MNITLMIWGVVFGIIGFGYFSYGRKQKASIPLIVGIALFAIPYVITNVTILIVTGLVLILTPIFIRQ